MLPLSLVDHSSFKDFVHELDSRYKIPGKKTVSEKISKLYETAQSLLRQDLSRAPNVALTHDTWTSIHTQTYDTVTVHYILPEWELRSTVLQTSLLPGSHTGENISDRLSKTLGVWDIKNPVFVTDNAANEQKAIRLLGLDRIGCYGHRLNLVVKHALKDDKASSLVTKGRSVVTFFHTSNRSTELLEEHQGHLPEKARGHKLIQDVPTRWNSSLSMLERLLEQKQALAAVASDNRLGKHAKLLASRLFTFEEQEEVDKLIKVLDPFQRATEMLSSDKRPTQGLILPVIVKLNKALVLKEDDSDMIKSLNTDMKQQLDLRTEDKDFALLAALLTPSLKFMPFAYVKEVERASQLLLDQLIELYSIGRLGKQEKPENVDENRNSLPPLPEMQERIDEDDDITILNDPQQGEPAAEKAKLEIKHDSRKDVKQECGWLDDVIFMSEEKALSPEEQGHNENKSYLSEPGCDGKSVSDLEWLQCHASKFPQVTVLAKKYLCIPASSVSSERVFSLTGNIISKKRSRLKPALVEKIVFLNKNKFLMKPKK